MIAGCIIGLVVGVLIGVFVMRLTRRSKGRCIGTLRVDQSDPNEAPYLFLVLKCDINTVKAQRYATFKVNVENYISQK